ncbi:hypothetical protein JCM3774_002109 [Rhodotorula dairenensis]
MADSSAGGAGDADGLAAAPPLPQPDLAAERPSKPLYSIFAPRTGSAVSASPAAPALPSKSGLANVQTAGDGDSDDDHDGASSAASSSTATATAATNKSNKSTSMQTRRTRAIRRAENDNAGADDDDDLASVLSLVEDSGESDADVVIEPTGKGKGKGKAVVAPSKKRATRAPGPAGEAKGKGRATKTTELFMPLPTPRRVKKRGALPTDKGEDGTEEDPNEGDDDDEPVVLSETGSTSSLLLGGGTASRRSRRMTPATLESTALARNASGSVILDLTTSPPRRDTPTNKTEKKKKNKQTQVTTTPPLASSSAGGHSGRGGVFAPLAEVYGAAREKRKKSQEGVEPRWPTAQEHLGGWPPPVTAARTNRVAGESGVVVEPRLDKGKGRQIDANDKDDNDDGAGIPKGEGFLARYAQGIDSATSSPPSTTCTTQLRPTASLPFLLPSPLPSHPLLDRVAESLRDPAAAAATGTSSSLRQEEGENRDSLWTVKYAPQNAEEVLGSASRQSAGWLKEWLEELKVVGAGEPFANGTKRRRKVARGVDPNRKKKKRKKRRHDGLEDFMASSSEEDDDDNGGAIEADYYARDLASSPFGSDADLSGDDRDGGARSASSATSSFPSLTNLILLQGPSGSGKSSTVHAVARQLGYEVFEVSAGFGRRSAKDLERYVGDAARNHVVNGASPRKKAGTLAAMFGRQHKKKEPGQAQATATATTSATKDRSTPEPSGLPETGPTQSLILIDEVDVFFRHEEDCWAGIAALAAQSRRPIVMTCTDSAHIPFDALNLQRVILPADHSTTISCLPFEAPEPELATAFLSLVALNEGHVLPAGNVVRLYESSTSRPYPAWMLQQQMGTARRARGGGYGARPLAPGTSTQPLVSRDLRKALMQLQLECQRGGGAIQGPPRPAGRVVMCEGPVRVPRSRDEGDDEEVVARTEAGISLEDVALTAGTLSWADAHVDTRIELMLEDAETGRTLHPNDVEYSYPIIEYLPNPDSTRLPYLGHEHDMANYLRTLAYRAWNGGVRFGEQQDEELEAKRAEYTTWFGLITQSGGENAIVQPPGAILPSARPILEIAPLLRHLTRLDDAGERALLEANRVAAAQGARDELESLAVVGSLSNGGGNSGGATGPGAQIGPRRSTRQRIKQGGGQPVYVRRLPWASEAEANWIRSSGFDDA